MCQLKYVTASRFFQTLVQLKSVQKKEHFIHPLVQHLSAEKDFILQFIFQWKGEISSSNSFFNGKEDFITSIHLSMERRIGTDNSNFPNKI